MPSHGTMYFDGRYKSIVYHGLDLGELYDLQVDPTECSDLWDSPEHQGLRAAMLLKHFDAVMATSGAGTERTDSY